MAQNGESPEEMAHFYGGQQDLFQFSCDLENAKNFPSSIHPQEDQSNFDDFHTESSNLSPSPSVLASQTSPLTPLRSNQVYTDQELTLPDNLIDELLNDNVPQAEIEANFNEFFVEKPELFQNKKCCVDDNELEDIHGDQPGSSYHMDEHLNNLTTEPELTFEIHESQGPITNNNTCAPEILIDNRENAPSTSVKCPLTGVYYKVRKQELAGFLKKNGTAQQEQPKLNQKEQEALVRRFCLPKEMTFVTEGDAVRLIESGYSIKRVELKKTANEKLPATKNKFNCFFCPHLQGHERGFCRKEDLKRHYHQHLNFVRFHCDMCDYKISRIDHIKTHMKNCHPGNHHRYTKHD